MGKSFSVALAVFVIALATVTAADSDAGRLQEHIGESRRMVPSHGARGMERSVKRSVQDGVYSAAQAERGEEVFRARCLACHQPEQFTSAYMRAWDGQPVANLLESIRSTMPEDDPGGLTRQEYVDTLSFLFRQNGFPAGPDELPSTPAALRHVIIEAPSKSAALSGNPEGE